MRALSLLSLVAGCGSSALSTPPPSVPAVAPAEEIAAPAPLCEGQRRTFTTNDGSFDADPCFLRASQAAFDGDAETAREQYALSCEAGTLQACNKLGMLSSGDAASAAFERACAGGIGCVNAAELARASGDAHGALGFLIEGCRHDDIAACIEVGSLSMDLNVQVSDADLFPVDDTGNVPAGDALAELLLSRPFPGARLGLVHDRVPSLEFRMATTALQLPQEPELPLRDYVQRTAPLWSGNTRLGYVSIFLYKNELDARSVFASFRLASTPVEGLGEEAHRREYSVAMRRCRAWVGVMRPSSAGTDAEDYLRSLDAVLAPIACAPEN